MNKDKKGVSIYLVVIMLSVLLSIALGLSSIIIGGAKMAESLGYSVKAFHAADTGIEWALYRIKKQTDCTSPFNADFGSADYGYNVTITYSSDCQDPGTVIESTGQYMTVKRKIEASY